MQQLLCSERYELMTDVFVLLLPFYEERRDYHVSFVVSEDCHPNCTGQFLPNLPFNFQSIVIL